MEDAVQELVNKHLKAASQKAFSTLNVSKEDVEMMRPVSKIQDYQGSIRALRQFHETVEKIVFSFDKSLIKKDIDTAYEVNSSKYNEEKIKIHTQFQERLERIQKETIDKAREYNQKLKEELQKSNSAYLELEEKRKRLASYEVEVLDFCSKHGITTGDTRIDNSTFTIEELSDVYDQYIKYMEMKDRKFNPIAKLRDVLKDNIILEGGVLVLSLCLAFTFLLDILAILFFAYIGIKQLRVQSTVKSYAILLGVLYNIQPLSMGYRNALSEDELLSEDLDLDNDPVFQPLVQEWSKAIDEIEEDNPEGMYKTMIKVLNSMDSSINNQVDKEKRRFEKEKTDLLFYIKNKIDRMTKEFEEAKSKLVRLGDEISSSPCFSTEFKLGVEQGILEVTYNLGLQNIIIHPGNKEETRKFIQLLFANALCNVKEGCLSVTIFDPYDFGQDLIMFYHESLQDLIKFENDRIQDTLSVLKEYAESNLKTMRGKDINQFNELAIKEDRTTKEYKLLIVLSEPKTIEDSQALKSFMEYSARLGVFVWVVANMTLPNTKIFKKPFDGISSPYQFDSDELATRVVHSLTHALENSETASLDWKSKVVPVICPDDKIWSWTADKYIELNPGFWEGDPTQHGGYTVGHDGNVHAIIVGTTGAGKSVFINQLIANATRKYPPRDLELWLVDYKGAEFAAYLPTEDHPKVLPHLQACLCTSDGEYSGSLYSALRGEAERRYKYIINVGYKSVYEYNEDVRAGKVYEYLDEDGEKKYTANPNLKSNMRKLGDEDLISRILFINDEFQVIFEKAETKTVEQIIKDIKYIAKVARAAAIHVVFASQSMKGTINDDTLGMFTLRFALRCDAEVSQAILGTKYASEIKQAFGYLYVRSQGDKSLSAQKRYRTPYAPDKDIRENINFLADKAEQERYPKRKLIWYDEAVKHRIDEIDDVYRQYKNNVPEGLMILGKPMTYSSNMVPENVILSATNNTHIVSCFSDAKDLVNFYQTIKRNVMQNKNAIFFVNSQIPDYHYICEIDKDMIGDQFALSNESTNVGMLINMFHAVFKLRKEKGKKDEPIYYVLIGWDKAVGFGIDRDYDLVNSFASLLQLCGEFNMHFIFICSVAKPIAASILSACKFKICGKCDEDSSVNLLGTRLASKIDESLKNGYMYLQADGVVSRCKIYQSKIEREVKGNKFIIN